MVTIFNRKKLFVDISQVECNRVKQILKTANINYFYKTVKSSPITSRISDVGASQHYAMPFNNKSDNSTFVYYIYVRRKDYKDSKELINS